MYKILYHDLDSVNVIYTQNGEVVKETRGELRMFMEDTYGGNI